MVQRIRQHYHSWSGYKNEARLRGLPNSVSGRSLYAPDSFAFGLQQISRNLARAIAYNTANPQRSSVREGSMDAVEGWGKAAGAAAGLAVTGGNPLGAMVGSVAGSLFETIVPSVGDIVGNIAGELGAAGVQKLGVGAYQRMRSQPTVVNHDLQHTFRQAALQAIYDIGGSDCFPDATFKPDHPVPVVIRFPCSPDDEACDRLQQIESLIRDQRRLALESKQDLAKVETYLTAQNVEHLNDAFVMHLLAPDDALFRSVRGLPELERHLQRHLLDRTLVHLGENLKENTEAWRTFNRLMLDMLLGELRAMAHGQKQILDRLDDLQPKLTGDAFVADLSDTLATLLQTTGEMRKEMHEGFRAVLRRAADQHRDLIQQLNAQHALLIDISADVKATRQTVEKIRDRLQRQPTTALHSIPAPPTDFIGRGKEIETIVTMLRAAKDGTVASICGVRGLSGIGKSTLAHQVAQELRDHFPDGQVFLALRGTSDTALSPEEALREVLRASSKETDPNLTLAQLENDYRDTLHGKHVLILADNAKDVAQVKPLTPPAGSALLITSRRLIRFADMPEPVELGKLPEGEAIAFAIKISPKLGTDAPTLTTLCGCLPLALRLSATRIAHSSSPVARQLTQLANERTRLRRMRGDDPEADIEAAFNQSFAALHADAQTLLRRLGVFAASFDRGAAVEVARLPGMVDDQYALDDVLDELRNLSLIEHDLATDRYSLHDLVRIFALERLREKNEEEQTHLHYIVHYLTEARVAQAQFLQGGENLLSGLKLFDRERAHTDALWTWAMQPLPHETRDALLLALADATIYIGDIRHDKRKERIPQLKAALAAARHQQDRAAEGRFLGGLGNAYVMLGDARGAIEYYKQQLVIVREIGDRQGEGNALGNSGNAYAMLGDIDRATDCYKQRLTIAKEIGDRRGEGNAVGNVGNVELLLGGVRRAIVCFEEQMAIMREIGDLRGEGGVLVNLGRTYANLGRVDLAIRHYEQAATVFEKLGDRHATGLLLSNLGDAYSDLGNTQRAIDYHQQWLAIAQGIGDRRGEGGALGGLGNTYYMLGELDLSITFSTRALTITREVGDRHGEGIALGNLGNAYSALGKADRAVECYEQALIITRPMC